MSEKKINYSEPFILDTIFKHAKEEEDGPQIYERLAQLAVTWEDIISIQSYPYDDAEWEQYKGEKFYITLREQGTQLCMGKFKQMFTYWKTFRKKYYYLEENGPDTEG
jgi:hypothetical protein